MNSTLIVTPEDLESIASKVNEQLTSFDLEITSLQKTMAELNTSWKGKDSKQYIDAMAFNYISDLNSLKSAIESYATFLQTAASDYNALETETNALFERIDV